MCICTEGQTPGISPKVYPYLIECDKNDLSIQPNFDGFVSKHKKISLFFNFLSKNGLQRPFRLAANHFDHTSRHLRSIHNFYFFYFFFTKWPPEW